MKYVILLFLLLSIPAFAIDYAGKAHEAYKEKNYPKAGDLYEKAYNQDKINVYLENAMAAYLSHAFNLSNDKEYEDAIKYCEKVLFLKPDNNNARELLSEIYFSRGSGYRFRGFNKKARNDMEKSLRYSVLPEQKQRALQELRDWKMEFY